MPVDLSLLLDEFATGDVTGSEGDNDTASDEELGGLSKTRPGLPVSDDEKGERDGDSSQESTTRRSKSKPRGPGISSQRGLRLEGGAGERLKRLLEGSEARKEARAEKRIKIQEERIRLEAEAQMHRIESKRVTAERVAEIQARSSVQLAEIQARSNERIAAMQQETMRMQMQMMEGLFRVRQARGA